MRLVFLQISNRNRKIPHLAALSRVSGGMTLFINITIQDTKKQGFHPALLFKLTFL